MVTANSERTKAGHKQKQKKVPLFSLVPASAISFEFDDRMRTWQRHVLDLVDECQSGNKTELRWIWVQGARGREGKTFLANWLHEEGGFLAIPCSAFQHPHVLHDMINHWPTGSRVVIDFGNSREAPYEEMAQWWTAVQGKTKIVVAFSSFRPSAKRLPLSNQDICVFSCSL